MVSWAWEGAALYVGTASSVDRCARKRSSRASAFVAMVNRPHISTPRVRGMFDSVETCTIRGSIPTFVIPYNVSSYHPCVLSMLQLPSQGADMRTDADRDASTSRQRQRAIQSSPQLVSAPSAPLHSPCETRPYGQRWTAIPGSRPEAKASKTLCQNLWPF